MMMNQIQNVRLEDVNVRNIMVVIMEFQNDTSNEMTKELGYGSDTHLCVCGNWKKENQLVCNKCHKKYK